MTNPKDQMPVTWQERAAKLAPAQRQDERPFMRDEIADLRAHAAALAERVGELEAELKNAGDWFDGFQRVENHMLHLGMWDASDITKDDDPAQTLINALNRLAARQPEAVPLIATPTWGPSYKHPVDAAQQPATEVQQYDHGSHDERMAFLNSERDRLATQHATVGAVTDEQIDAIWEAIPGKSIIAGESQANWNRALRRAFARALLSQHNESKS